LPGSYSNPSYTGYKIEELEELYNRLRIEFPEAYIQKERNRKLNILGIK